MKKKVKTIFGSTENLPESATIKIPKSILEPQSELDKHISQITGLKPPEVDYEVLTLPKKHKLPEGGKYRQENFGSYYLPDIRK